MILPHFKKFEKHLSLGAFKPNFIPLMGVYKPTIKELMYFILFQKRPTIGALMDTTSIPGTTEGRGYWIISEKGAVATTTMATEHKKWKFPCIFIFYFLYLEPPPVRMNGTLEFSLCLLSNF